VETKFVRALFDIECTWEGMPPVYRVYVNDELFTERDWIWDSQQYLTQILQIQASPGLYRVRIEPVGPQLANFVTKDHRVEHGEAQWTGSESLLIR